MTDPQYTCYIMPTGDSDYPWRSVIEKNGVIFTKRHSNLLFAEWTIKRRMKAIRRAERQGIEVRP